MLRLEKHNDRQEIKGVV